MDQAQFAITSEEASLGKKLVHQGTTVLATSKYVLFHLCDNQSVRSSAPAVGR